MTDIERAIKHFENVRDGAIVVLNSGFGNKPNESPTLYKRRKLNAELAISALEKQIPKKPIPYFCDEYKCSICGELVNLESGYKQPFCYECGQAVDWSDIE